MPQTSIVVRVQLKLKLGLCIGVSITAIVHASVDYSVTFYMFCTVIHVTRSIRSLTILLLCPVLILDNIRSSIYWDKVSGSYFTFTKHV